MLDPVNRALEAFVAETRRGAAQVDAYACELMRCVQAEVDVLWPGAAVVCYGSRACGLACASSDVDLCVVGVPGLDDLSCRAGTSMDAQLRALERLSSRLRESLPDVQSLSVQRATVPVLACDVPMPGGARTILEHSGDDTCDDGSGDGDGGGAKLRLDVSLHTPAHSGMLAAHHLRCLSLSLPDLAPLVLVLKQLLRRQQLKAAYTGGLSSYALAVMASHYLLDPAAQAAGSRPATSVANTTTFEADDASTASSVDPASAPAAAPPPTTLAELLLGFLHFYGDVFDASRHAVCPAHGESNDETLASMAGLDGNCGGVVMGMGGFAHRHHPALLQYFGLHPLVVLDPTLPSSNLAHSCYRAAQVQQLFRSAATALRAAAANAALATANVATPSPRALVLQPGTAADESEDDDDDAVEAVLSRQPSFSSLGPAPCLSADGAAHGWATVTAAALTRAQASPQGSPAPAPSHLPPAPPAAHETEAAEEVHPRQMVPLLPPQEMMPPLPPPMPPPPPPLSEADVAILDALFEAHF